MGSAEAAEPTKLAETTYRDVNIALANEFARSSRTNRDRHRSGHRCGQLTAVLAHPPAGHRRRRPLHPRVSALLSVGRSRRRGCRWSRARSTTACRDTPSISPRRRAGGRIGRRPGVDPRCDLPRRRQGNGILGGVRRPAGRSRAPERATAWPADPLYDDAELRALGFEPWDGGEIDAAIVQADHAAYAPAHAGGSARRAGNGGRARGDRPGAAAGGEHSGPPHRQAVRAQNPEFLPSR